MPAKSRQYWKCIAPHKARLSGAVPHDELHRLHRRSGGRHLAYAARQFAIIAASSVALFRLDNPLYWVPFAILQGFTFFNMTVLLHEAVHNTIFARRRDTWTRLLGLLYAITSGISASQFTRWHLDHHDNLGSSEDDPKRRWLSPKRNTRLYKLLYCTPVLMVFYFRAAARETGTYPAALRRRIAIERVTTVAIQLAVTAALLHLGGWGPALRVQLIPYLFVFPIAFTLNRLGQHYDIDPAHPLKWATLMRPSRAWDFLFLYSSYHIEHHYFPGVPFYNLRKLHLQLRPLYAELGLVPRTYRELVWGWFVQNHRPHTRWATPSGKAPAGATAR